MQKEWRTVRAAIDPERFAEVDSFLSIQAREARWWRDAALSYFQTFSKLPIPAGYAKPEHPLEYYEKLRCPADARKPRCVIGVRPEVHRSNAPRRVPVQNGNRA
jgi:alpha-glucuronidase